MMLFAIIGANTGKKGEEMDREKLNELKTLVDQLLGENEPSDEDLDFDDDAIQMYADLHNLKESMERMGF